MAIRFDLESLEQRRLLAARVLTDLVSGWRFSPTDPAGAMNVSFDDSAWASVSLPHSINSTDGQDGGGDYLRTAMWYRQRYTMPAGDAARRTFIKIDAAGTLADVFVNGAYITTHRGPFAAFSADISSALVPGSLNVIAIRVKNTYDETIAPHSGDFNINGGLYRGVSILVTDPVQISPLDLAGPGVYLTPSNVSAASATLGVRTLVRNTTTVEKSLQVRSILFDASGVQTASTTLTWGVPAGQVYEVPQTLSLASPRLWNGIADPYLYTARIQIIEDGVVADEIEQRIGFRTFAITSQGFFLNGNPYQLHGSNLHESRLHKGPALSDADREQDLQLLLEMGSNGVRLVHWQHDQYTYRRCDELGLIVWTEIPIWGPNTPTTPAMLANQTQQLRELIRQNYNHTSVAVWGLFNEVNDTAAFRSMTQSLQQVAGQEDTSRPTTAASWSNFAAGGINSIVDAVAFNKYSAWYGGTFADFDWGMQNLMSQNPNNAIGMSEFGAGGSVIQHQVPPVAPVPQGTFHPEEYQALFHEEYLRVLKKHPRLWCIFPWQFTDSAADNRYEGDTFGRNDKGLVNFDRSIRKDAFYLYKANWSPARTIHIASERYKTRPAGPTEIKAYANVSELELFVNGVSQGKQTPDTVNVFKWTGVVLASGRNEVMVRAPLRGGVNEDRVIWVGTAPASFSQFPILPAPVKKRVSPNFFDEPVGLSA